MERLFLWNQRALHKNNPGRQAPRNPSEDMCRDHMERPVPEQCQIPANIRGGIHAVHP